MTLEQFHERRVRAPAGLGLGIWCEVRAGQGSGVFRVLGWGGEGGWGLGVGGGGGERRDLERRVEPVWFRVQGRVQSLFFSGFGCESRKCLVEG